MELKENPTAVRVHDAMIACGLHPRFSSGGLVEVPDVDDNEYKIFGEMRFRSLFGTRSRLTEIATLRFKPSNIHQEVNGANYLLLVNDRSKMDEAVKWAEALEGQLQGITVHVQYYPERHYDYDW